MEKGITFGVRNYEFKDRNSKRELYGHDVTLNREIKGLEKIDLIVTTLIHNHDNDSIPAVESFIRQKNNTNSIMLIVDDGTSRFTIDNERIYVARIPQCNVARARISMEHAGGIFPMRLGYADLILTGIP